MIRNNSLLDPISIRLTELCSTVKKYEIKQEKSANRLI